MHPLRRIIRAFDRWLSRQLRVQVFTNDPQVIMRIQLARAPRAITLADGVVAAGAEVLLLHAHNERMPLIPPEGADLAYAVQLRRLQVYSLKATAKHIQAAPSLQDVQAVGGITAHVTLEEANGGRAMLEHLGFKVFPYYRPLGAFGEFWENFFTWWLMWAYNPASTQRRSMLGLQRVEFWMGVEEFLTKFGAQ